MVVVSNSKELSIMKKNLFIVMAAMAMGCVATSCDKNEDVFEPVKKTLSATASIDGDGQTRTVYVEQGSGNPILKVNWDVNETFKAYYEGSDTPLLFNKENNGSFEATDVPEGVTASTPFVGIYGQKVSYEAATGKYTVDYSGQDGTLENLAKYDVMVASSEVDAEGLHFPFKHKSAFLRITLKDDATTDKKHKDEHSTDAGRKSFAITFQFNTCKFIDENMVVTEGMLTDRFIVSFSLASELNDGEERIIYVAIPAMILTKKSGGLGGGGTIGVVTEGYHKTVNSNLTFEPGKLYTTTIEYNCAGSHSPTIIW